MKKKRRFRYIWLDNYMAKRFNLVNNDAIIEILSKYHKYGEIESVMKYVNYESLRYAYYTLRYSKDNGNNWIINEEKAPGLDGMTLEEFGNNLEVNINNILVELKSSTYKPKVLKRTFIPKKPRIIIEDNKEVIKKENRPINLLSIKDKILQITMNNQILVPILDELFTEESFAYRPNKDVKSAINHIQKIVEKYDIRYALILDIEKYFDSINQELLIEMLKEIYKDKTFIRLIKNIIETGYLENGKIIKPIMGCYQGMPISSTLANLFLYNVLDIWYKSNIKTNSEIFMVRYADDVIVFGKELVDITYAYECIRDRFKEYLLFISETKSRIVDLQEEMIVYLGYEIEIKDKRLYRYISQKKLKEIMDKISIMINDAINDFDIFITKGQIGNRKRIIAYFQDYVRDINDLLVGIYRFYNDINNPLILDTIYNYAVKEIENKWNILLFKDELEFISKNLKKPKYTPE